MARKTLSDRYADAVAELELARKKLAKLDNEIAVRIGKIAIKTGLVNLGLSDDELRAEFAQIVERRSKGKSQ